MGLLSNSLLIYLSLMSAPPTLGVNDYPLNNDDLFDAGASFFLGEVTVYPKRLLMDLL